MSHRLPANTHPSAIRMAAATGMAAAFAGLVVLALTAPTDQASAPVGAPVSSVPSAAPVTIPGHAVPGVKMVADSPSAPSPSIPAPVTPAPRKVAPVVKAPTKTAPRTQTQDRRTYTVSCTNGYLHADGSCSSTPTEPVFTPPVQGGPCSGTASQCLDATGGGDCNEISSFFGSGTPGCVVPVTP
jgi:hypothetical protein